MAWQPLFPDTDEKTERVLLELVRTMSCWQKMEQVADLTNTVRQLALTGLKERYPGASEEVIRFRFAELVLGRDLALRVRERAFDAEARR